MRKLIKDEPTTEQATATETSVAANIRLPFVKPAVTPHDKLPKVTTGFVGTFDP